MKIWESIALVIGLIIYLLVGFYLYSLLNYLFGFLGLLIFGAIILIVSIYLMSIKYRKLKRELLANMWLGLGYVFNYKSKSNNSDKIPNSIKEIIYRKKILEGQLNFIG
jgi:hypothetical protein